MKMSSYKLTYFNITGLNEPIRFLLYYLNIDFEEVRIQRDQWPSIKPTTPFGKVPVLEIDGKVLNQCMAITRYLSKKAGLAGSDDWESLLIDIAVDNITDLRTAISTVLFNSDNEESKAAKLGTLINETVPFYMDKLEKIVANNNGYLVNGKLSWADLYFVSIVDTLSSRINIDILESRPKLRELKERVLALPQIKLCVEKRPKNEI